MNANGAIRQGHASQVSEVLLGDEDSNNDIPARMLVSGPNGGQGTSGVSIEPRAVQVDETAQISGP